MKYEMVITYSWDKAECAWWTVSDQYGNIYARFVEKLDALEYIERKQKKLNTPPKER